MVFLMFLTANTYTQVAVAVALYPAVAYIALNIIPRRKKKQPAVSVSPVPVLKEAIIEKPVKATDANTVVDTDKRAFFKLIGAAGLSIFLFSLFNRRAELPFFGKIAGNEPSGPSQNILVDSTGAKVDPSERQPLDGYQIAEIDDNIITFYGMSNKQGAWVITREDTDSNSFRYAKGDSDFGSNWEKREKLTYSYFHDVF
jgi:hypothetical protein